jgi:hypothetical protein
MESRDEKNNTCLHNAVLKIRVLRTELEVFFERLDNNCNYHVDDHEHNQKNEEVMPKVSCEGIDEELLVEVTCTKKCAWRR